MVQVGAAIDSRGLGMRGTPLGGLSGVFSLGGLSGFIVCHRSVGPTRALSLRTG